MSDFQGPPYNCWYCGGKIKAGADAKSSGAGCLLVVVGLCFAPVLIGIPVLLYGLHVGSKKEGFWRCRACGAKFPREIKWYEFG